MILATFVGGPDDGKTLPFPGREQEEAPFVLAFDGDLEFHELDHAEGIGPRPGVYEINHESMVRDGRGYLRVTYDYTGGTW